MNCGAQSTSRPLKLPVTVARLETRERGVFQMDTVPAIAGHCRTIPKHYRGAGEQCHAITDAPTDGTAVE